MFIQGILVIPFEFHYNPKIVSCNIEILCDVACGKQNEMRRSLYMQNAPPPYHSVKAIGQFNTTSNIPWTSTDMFAPELSIGPMHVLVYRCTNALSSSLTSVRNTVRAFAKETHVLLRTDAM